MATVNIREERIELTAVDKMSAVMRQAQGGLNQFRSSLDTVKNALAAVGLTVGVGAMLKLYADVLKATAALDDMSEMTGASVENLSKLQTVAKIGGRDFEFVGESIGKMIKGLKGADEEGQNAGKAMEFLGIKVKNSDGTFRDTAVITTEVAKALDKYADSGNKVALVQDIYGKGAQRMLPYLKDLAEAGEINAKVTKEQAAQAEQAEKNLRRLQIAMEDTKRTLVIGLTPAISDFLEKMLLANQASGGWISGLATMAGADTSNIPARLNEIDRLLKSVDTSSMGSKVAGIFTGGASSYLDAISESRLLNERDYLLRIQKARADKAARGGAADPNSPLFEFGGAVLPYESKGKDDKGAAARALQEAVFRAEKQVELEEMAATDSREAWAVYTKGRIEQDKAFKEGHEQMWKDVFKTIDDEQAAAIEQGRELLEAQAEATKIATQEAERFAMTIDLAFDRAVRGGGDFLDILKQLGTELAMIEIKKRFFEPASKGLSGFLDNLFKGGGASTTAGADMGMAGAAVIGGPAYAEGTDYVPRTGWAMLHQGERVVPAAQNVGGGGVTVVQHINVDSRSDRASIIQAMHFSKEQAKAEIVDSLRRGSARFRSP